MFCNFEKYLLRKYNHW